MKTMSEYYRSSDNDIWQAADYALGALKQGDRISAEKRLLNDPVFRRSVEHWQNVFTGLYDDIEPLQPGRDVWRQIKNTTRPASIVTPPAARTHDHSAFWQMSTSLLSLVCLGLLGLLVFATGGDLRPNSGLHQQIATLEKENETLKAENSARENKLTFSLNETNAVEEELVSTNLALVELSQKYELSNKSLELANYKLRNLEKELDVQVRQLQLKEKEIDAYVRELDISAKEIDTYEKALDSNAREINALRTAIDKVSTSSNIQTPEPSQMIDIDDDLPGNVPTRSPRGNEATDSGARSVSGEVLGLDLKFDAQTRKLELGWQAKSLVERKPFVFFQPAQGGTSGEAIALGSVNLENASSLELSDEFAAMIKAGGTVTLVSGDGARKTTLAKGTLH